MNQLAVFTEKVNGRDPNTFINRIANEKTFDKANTSANDVKQMRYLTDRRTQPLIYVHWRTKKMASKMCVPCWRISRIV